MPGLEILADNVRCTDGATSCQIDEDELFYPDRAAFQSASPNASSLSDS